MKHKNGNQSSKLLMLGAAVALLTGATIGPAFAQTYGTGSSSGSDSGSGSASGSGSTSTNGYGSSSGPDSTVTATRPTGTDTGVTGETSSSRVVTSSQPPARTAPTPPREESRTAGDPGSLIPEGSTSVFSEIATAREDIPAGASSEPTQFGVLPDDWTMTQWGPMSPADKDFVIAVRLAGLWEGPAGQQAQEKGRSPIVREIGGHISAQHFELDERVREVAEQLNVNLPNRPTKQQMGWLNEMGKAEGEEYDRQFTNRLRAAHGGIFPVIADVRAGTRNELVRTFASETNDVVLGHIAMLEATGLVDYSELPTPYHPQTITVMQSMKALFASAGTGNLYLQIALGVIVLAVSLTSWRMFRPGPKISRRKTTGKAR